MITAKFVYSWNDVSIIFRYFVSNFMVWFGSVMLSSLVSFVISFKQRGKNAEGIILIGCHVTTVLFGL